MKRNINNVSYDIEIEDSFKHNGSRYYKVQLVEATRLSDGLTKYFTVSKTGYYGEYPSVRAGIKGSYK